jgi:TetR/AcrR family transcriptional regulator, transcriptional repressor for nem operon
MPRPKNFKKEEVLQKAKELFWQKGFEATSIQDLVEHLGINKQSLYDTFGDKQTLYLSALNNYRLENELWLNSLNLSNGSVKESFKLLFESVITGVCDDSERKGCFLTNATVESSSKNTEVNKICVEGMESLEKRFSNLIKQGQASGELKNELDADGIASFFYVILNGLRAVGKIKEDKGKLNEVIKNTLSVLN